MRKDLVKIRKQRGISQKQMAEAIGITPTALCRFEKGQSDMKVKHLFAYIDELDYEFRLLLKNN